MINRRAAALAMVVLFLLTGDIAAATSIDISVLWEPDARDDAQVYMHAANIVYPIRRHRIEAIYERMQRPDLDYPILAFIAYNARADVRTVWAWRSKDHSWFEVMTHFGVKPDALFVALPDAPRRPYGKAYGYWKKHRNATTSRHVSDDDVRFWISLRTVASFSGMSIESVYARYQKGEKIRHIAGDHHRNEGDAVAKSSRNHPARKNKKGSSPGY